MQRIKLRTEPSVIAKHEAFHYQKEAFNVVKDLEYAAIFHEQGLGKTKIAIDTILYWLENKLIDTVLIVTKKQLIANWVSEFKEHTFIKPSILTSNKVENFYVFNGANRVVLTNFEVISSELDRFKLFLKTREVAIIIDESAKLKNPDSNITKNLFELSKLFKKRIIMTGTPVANRPFDIWAQIYFLDSGKSLGDSFVNFRKHTDLSNQLNFDVDLASEFEECIESIYAKISSFTVRETKKSGVIHLPDKVYIKRIVNFELNQQKMYEKVKNEMTILIHIEEKTVIDDSTAILKRLLRLVQITSNPRLIDELYGEISGKEKELDILIREILSRNEKCIVWSIFIDNINYFNNKYRMLGSVKVHGSMKMDDRVKSIDRFKNDPNINILFATPASSKEGLTLTVANNVIFYDRGFSLDDYLQAQDRIHRISQNKICNIYNLIMSNSIDEWVDILLKSKENAAHLTQGDISYEEYLEKVDYSFGDIIKNILLESEEK